MEHQVAVTEHSVTLTRTFEAPPEALFSAWVTPALFARWFGTPPYLTDPASVEMELRPGGRWKATMVSAEDGTELPFLGTYVEIDAPDRLVMTFEDPQDPANRDRETLTVTFRDLGDGSTQLRLTQDGLLPAEQYPLLAEGYGRFLDRMADVVAEG